MEYIINSKKYGQKIVLLDEEDYKAVINENYSLSLTYDKTIKNFYVAFTKKPSKGGSRLLHRYIMQPSKGMTVDHINRNPLDNRKSNLRVVICQQNSQNKGNYKNNKTGIKNVYYCNIHQCYIVEIKYNKQVLKRKHCKTLDEAKTWREILIKQLGLEGVM